MQKRLKLLHIQHSGKLRAHEHTSYLPLTLLLILTAVVLSLFTYSAKAATPYNGPEAGSIGLTGTVPAAPPKVAATITIPINGQHFKVTPITVAGTCPAETLVEIFKNKIFAGSVPCDSNGRYSLQIDLLFGKNVLTAQVYDVLNQAGPISKSVTVYYDYALATGAASNFLDFTGMQLILETDAAYRGSFPNENMSVPITVIGGTAPFAINIQWGDGTNQVIARPNNATFNTSHAYKKAGTFKITLQATDRKGLVAFLTVAAIINGKPEPIAATTDKGQGKTLMLWPFFAIAATAVACFWIGEKREKHVLKAKDGAQVPVFGVAQVPQQIKKV